MAMRAWQHPHRAVVRPAIIEVEPDGKHVFQDADRRLDVNHPSFLAPGRETRNVAPLPDSDSEILVPRHLPVGVGILVEEDAADGEGVGTENRYDKVGEDCTAGKSDNFGAIEKVAVASGYIADQRQAIQISEPVEAFSS